MSWLLYQTSKLSGRATVPITKLQEPWQTGMLVTVFGHCVFKCWFLYPEILLQSHIVIFIKHLLSQRFVSIVCHYFLIGQIAEQPIAGQES